MIFLSPKDLPCCDWPGCWKAGIYEHHGIFACAGHMGSILTLGPDLTAEVFTLVGPKWHDDTDTGMEHQTWTQSSQ